MGFVRSDRANQVEHRKIRHAESRHVEPRRISWGARKLLTVGMLTILAFLLTASMAFAHGDVGLVSERLTLEPGETKEFAGELHYHRLVGRAASDGPVTMLLVDHRTQDVVASYGPDVKLSFNELIRCCDDTGWAPHTLILENAGSSTTTVDITARLVHDDLAVMVYGAESGTRESVAVFGLIWAAVVWRVTRGRKPPLTLQRSLGVTAGLLALVAVLSMLGFIKYGAGGPPALLAGLSEISLIPFNSAVSGVSILIAILIFMWGLASVWWIRAKPLSAQSQWTALGLLLAALPVTTGLLVAGNYDGVGIPLSSAVVATAPNAFVLWRGSTMKPGDPWLPSPRKRKPDGQLAA